jgi:thiamine transport system substrate-binding protein
MNILRMICLLVLSHGSLTAFGNELVVYTTSSFASGVGKFAKDNFEKKYNCKVDYQSFSGLEQMASRKGYKPKGDGIVGVSYELLVKNDLMSLFVPLEIEKREGFSGWEDKRFIPIFYALLGFVYDSNKISKPIESFEDLLKSHQKIIVTDPRTSNPGFGLLLWIKRIYGERAKDYWKRLSPQILTSPKSWSESYSLFMKGEAPIVLGFNTSPAYHRLVDHKKNFKAIKFKEGNYVQYSVAGMFKESKHKELFKKFVEYLLSEEVQTEIAFKDWSYPIRPIKKSLPEEFRPITEKDAPLPIEQVNKNKKKWVKEWLEALVS